MVVDKKGMMFVLSSPSGVGKTTLTKKLAENNSRFVISISHTTRKPRPNEIDGKDYHFIEEKKFKDLINKDFFLEYAIVFGNYYGTSHFSVKSELETGKNIILEIDWQGMRKIKSAGLTLTSIFILPPSYRTLRERLLNRNEDNIKIIDQRMSAAIEEISHYNEFEFIIINDDFEETLIKLEEIIGNPMTNSCRQSAFFDNFIEQMMVQKDLTQPFTQ